MKGLPDSVVAVILAIVGGITVFILTQLTSCEEWRKTTIPKGWTEVEKLDLWFSIVKDPLGRKWLFYDYQTCTSFALYDENSKYY